jgi:hypothetical protein
LYGLGKKLITFIYKFHYLAWTWDTIWNIFENYFGTEKGDLLGITLGLIYGLSFGLRQGLCNSLSISEIKTRKIPNEGIFNSFKNACLMD